MVLTFLLALMGTALVDSFDCYHQIYLDGLERAAIAKKVIAKLKGTSGQKEHFFMVLIPASSNSHSKTDKIIYCEKFIETPFGYADAYVPALTGTEDWANVTITTGFNGKSWGVVSIDKTNPWTTIFRLAEIAKPYHAVRNSPQWGPYRNANI